MSRKLPACRGIRGAITVTKNSRSEILQKTAYLLKKMMEKNHIPKEEISSGIFSVTRDLNAEFPAVAARELGLIYTPLLCTYEIDVPKGLKRCIRILLHVNTTKNQNEMVNIYLDQARKLRPDLGEKEEGLYYTSNAVPFHNEARKRVKR